MSASFWIPFLARAWAAPSPIPGEIAVSYRVGLFETKQNIPDAAPVMKAVPLSNGAAILKSAISHNSIQQSWYKKRPEFVTPRVIIVCGVVLFARDKSVDFGVSEFRGSWNNLGTSLIGCHFLPFYSIDVRVVVVSSRGLLAVHLFQTGRPSSCIPRNIAQT